jgi:AcrR family transcriptional regulator
MSSQATSHDPDDSRRRALLEAAITVFMRFGFRKTSMDEVARAAHVSRQALYLHFSSKDELFRAAVKHLLEGSLQAAAQAARDPQLSVEQKLVRVFDAWMGRYVGMYGADASDLAEAAGTLVGPLFTEHEGQFTELCARIIGAGGLAAAYRPAGLTARQLADTLYATGRGLKHSSPSREAFGRSMTVAVKALCLPLGGPS